MKNEKGQENTQNSLILAETVASVGFYCFISTDWTAVLFHLYQIRLIRWIQPEPSMIEGYWEIFYVYHSQLALKCDG